MVDQDPVEAAQAEVAAAAADLQAAEAAKAKGTSAPVVTPPPAAGATVVLSVVWPNDFFDPAIAGVPVLSREGTTVPAAQVDAVKAAAKAAGITLSEKE